MSKSLLKSGAPGAPVGELGEIVHRFSNFLPAEYILNELKSME